MIKNERQYWITKKQAKRIIDALDSHLERPANEEVAVHPQIAAAQRNALKSQLEDLEQQLRDYEFLKAGNFDFETLTVVADVPATLIKCRIAKGLSQKDLAERLQLKEQQIQRYESTDYSSASFARIKAIAEALRTTLKDSAPGNLPLPD